MNDGDTKAPGEMQDEPVEIDEAGEPITTKKPEPEENTPEKEKPEEPKQEKTAKKSTHRRFAGWYKSHKKLSIPLTVVLLLIIIGAVPWSRYHAVGLAYKKDFTVQAINSTTNSPISGATITVDAAQATTDENGNATLHLSVGQHLFTFSKKYYRSSQFSATVPIFSEKKIPAISMQATGRQAKITIKDVITKKPLAGVEVDFAGTEAKTDSSGNTTIVLPAGTTSQKADLSLNGYNDASVTVQVSNTSIKQNDFTLTPVGKIYFLSNATGTLNVMKSDLDGKNAQVVLAGTSSETISNTVLSASADWKYIALLTKRSTSSPGPDVYVISASDDRLLTVDSGDADFEIIGWIGDSLIYTVSRNDIPAWQSSKYKLKSYDATTGKITLLDQTSATGDVNAYAYQYYSDVLISGNTVVYFKDWSYAYDSTLLIGKQSTISKISADGQNHKTAASYDAAANTMAYVQHSPDEIYIWQQAATQTASKFFDYIVGSSPKQIALSQSQFYQNTPIYYWSFSGNQVFWNEIRNGNTLLVGDSTGANTKTILSQSDYMPYGWYGDQYLLVSKNSDELYIMPSSGGTPLKITSYQQTMTGM